MRVPLTNVWASEFSEGSSITLPSLLFTKELEQDRQEELLQSCTGNANTVKTGNEVWSLGTRSKNEGTKSRNGVWE